MNEITATLDVKEITQAYDFELFFRVRLKAEYLKNGTWLQPKTFQPLSKH